jgi:hypothetical protein
VCLSPDISVARDVSSLCLITQLFLNEWTQHRQELLFLLSLFILAFYTSSNCGTPCCVTSRNWETTQYNDHLLEIKLNCCPNKTSRIYFLRTCLLDSSIRDKSVSCERDSNWDERMEWWYHTAIPSNDGKPGTRMRFFFWVCRVATCDVTKR